jgi:hypothetical protein
VSEEPVQRDPTTSAPREGSQQPAVSPPGAYDALTVPESEPRVRSFSWIRLDSLWGSRNDVLAKSGHDPVFPARRAWMRCTGRSPSDDLLITRHAGEKARLLLLGDTGEGDHSQFALLPMLRKRYADSDFMLIASDVIYPAGGAGEYPDKFYLPYDSFPGPIYALPGNHDWYDLLEGFMFHFCDAEPLPEKERPRLSPLWRTRFKPADEPTRTARAERRRRHGAPQPAPYFAIEAGPVLIVCIDTGITNGIDGDQGDWLRRVSALPGRPKVLVTGKPLLVDNRCEPCEIEGGGTVDAIVRDPANHYVAAIGGDIHNYQRYPVTLPGGRTLQYIVSGGGGAFMSATHPIADISLGGVSEEAFTCFPSRSASLGFYSRRVPGVVRGLFLQALVLTLLIVAAWISGRLDPWLQIAATALALPVAAAWIYFVGIGGPRLLIAYRRDGIPDDDAKLIMAAARPRANYVVAPADPTARPGWRSRWIAKSLLGHHGGRRGFAHLFLSELYDSDKPNFYKSFLQLEADRETLAITCYAVTGSEAAGDEPLVEERVEIPLSATPPPPASQPFSAWAVFSAWRGNRALFARAVEIAIAEIGAVEGSPPACEIVVHVRDSKGPHAPGPLIDEERFQDPDAFVERLTTQALGRWTQVDAVIGGTAHHASIRMRRGDPETRGVSLTVAHDDVSAADGVRRIRDRIAAGISRGGFRSSSEPTVGEDDGRGWDRDAALARRIGRRQRTVLRLAVLSGLLAGGALTLLGWAIAAALTTGSGGEVGAAIAALLLFVGVLGYRDRLFPAIEIANVTPGRRIFQLATRGLGAGTLVSVGVQVLGRLLK